MIMVAEDYNMVMKYTNEFRLETAFSFYGYQEPKLTFNIENCGLIAFHDPFNYSSATKNILFRTWAFNPKLSLKQNPTQLL